MTALALSIKGKAREAFGFIALCLAALALVFGLKGVIDAPRPGTVDPSVIQYAVETSSAMPSGHALASIVILGWVWLRGSRSMRLLAVIASFVFLIGLSRVYLGVHYPSQVIAGWAIGTLILWVFSRLFPSVSSSSKSSSVDSR
jgi:membrane-associated phospholipid phosphatase